MSDNPDGLDHIRNAKSTREAIQLAVGAASSCWSNLQGAGTFESERASAIVEAVMERRIDIPVTQALATLETLLSDQNIDNRVVAARQILDFAIRSRDQDLREAVSNQP